jgi:PPOX class probable F420-dependent enzyme
VSQSEVERIDGSTLEGARALERLESERMGWLTTVDSHGTPQASPVWFLWNGETILTYSLDSARVRNIIGHPMVSFNLDSDGKDADIVIIEGEAHLDRSTASVADNPAFLAKYQHVMDGYGWSVESFSARFDVPVVVIPTRFRYW